MADAVQFLPGTGPGREATSGFHHQRVQGKGERGELQQCFLEVQGLWNHILVVDSFRELQGGFAWAECDQFQCFRLLLQPLECVWGEVFT